MGDWRLRCRRASLQVVEQQQKGFQSLLLVQIELEVACSAHVGVGVEHVQVHVQLCAAELAPGAKALTHVHREPRVALQVNLHQRRRTRLHVHRLLVRRAQSDLQQTLDP